MRAKIPLNGTSKVKRHKDTHTGRQTDTHTHTYDSVSDKRWKMGAQMRYFGNFGKKVKIVFC